MKLPLSVLIVFLAIGLVGFSRAESGVARDKANNAAQPDRALVDRLDHVIQERFLTAPFFGARRIGPQPNPHLDHFRPNTQEERDTVAAIESGGWKTGIYLMGRRCYPAVVSVQDKIEKIHVEKRLSLPVPVTEKTRAKDLPRVSTVASELDPAFAIFNTSSQYDFTIGKWSYYARPVRAQESCLKCHTDFFVTAKLPNNRYTFRKRKVGDTIGVLIYAFSK